MRTDEVVFLVFIGAILVVIFTALNFRYKKRELQHKERMAAIEKGAQLPLLSDLHEKPASAWTPRIYLLRGLIWLFSGIGLTIFLLGLSTIITTSRPPSLERKLFRAAEMRKSGVPEEQVEKYLNESGTPTESQDFPAALALIGLVPSGVGLAYIIFHLGERKMLATSPRDVVNG